MDEKNKQAEPVAWMTHHDEPMIFPTRSEAEQHCDDDEQPIALYAAPAPVVSPAALTERTRDILTGNLECLEFCADVVKSTGSDSMAEGLMAVHYAIKTLAASPADQGEDARDAARYRRIRNGPYSDQHGDVYAMTFQGDGDIPIHREELDRIVDAAMSASKEGA
ncbi:hypothetical protein CBM2637_A140074 [Cupriavidus taiwanensis]|nr:hypothetical protein CBM2637_A140074 [Cupriavidus taiwanensis]